jgi:AcrR family transcriptional regulator
MESKRRTERRKDALSKERIVENAIAILDAGGETALTFRALTARLATGPGAIYNHVANKDELLDAAIEAVIVRALADIPESTRPHGAIRAICLGVFDAIARHPWVGAQLSSKPWGAAVLHLFEAIGSRLAALDVPEAAQFDYASALLNYLLGLAGQHAARARLVTRDADRTAFLEALAAQWAALGPENFPFLHRQAAHLPEHDDRDQFLAGVDLILAGITATTRGPVRGTTDSTSQRITPFR